MVTNNELVNKWSNPIQPSEMNEFGSLTPMALVGIPHNMIHRTTTPSYNYGNTYLEKSSTRSTSRPKQSLMPSIVDSTNIIPHERNCAEVTWSKCKEIFNVLTEVIN